MIETNVKNSLLRDVIKHAEELDRQGIEYEYDCETYIFRIIGE